MRREELLDLIRGGEDSNVEFKRDDLRVEDLARELVAFLNFEGGVLLLGVEDDGSVSGTTRENVEEWVAELCRSKISPPLIPSLSWAREVGPGKDVLSVRVPVGLDKPYALVHNNRHTYFVRVGSSCREASREELERMFQSAGHLQYGLKPVPGTTLHHLDRRRLRDYFTRILRGTAPDDHDVDGWLRLLSNLELMIDSNAEVLATVDGMLLFGKTPRPLLSQSGVRALCYSGTTTTYETRGDEGLVGPLVPLLAMNGSIIERGLVEQCWNFIQRNTGREVQFEGARRIETWRYPETVVREVLLNALVHRDYSIAGSEITLTIYSDRLEIMSPGRLPNTMTVDRMKAGLRYARNQRLVNVMRDYGYVEARGMGLRETVIPGMRSHNGTEPEFIAQDDRLTVRLLGGSA